MKVNANSLRSGNVVEHQNRLWVVVKHQHTMPGKGGAFIQVELKDIQSGTKLNERFRSSETIEQVRLDQQDYQYLYQDGDHITVMDTNTYDQIMLNKDLLGDKDIFLQDGMMLTVESHEGKALSIVLPETVVLEVVEAETVIRGQTAASSNKPAKLSNGIRVMVPPFIEPGDKVVVRTEDSTYLERAK